MEMSTLNIWAVLVSAVAGFMVGGIWYSPLMFSKAWVSALNIDVEKVEGMNMTKIMSLSFVYHLIMAFCLGMFLNDSSIGLSEGAFYGFLTGFGWIFFVLATNSMYENRPFKYVLITGGHWVVTFTIMGLILGAWK